MSPRIQSTWPANHVCAPCCFICVYTDGEKNRVGHRHMRLADESVHVPGGAEWEDNVNLLVSVAHRCGVDAVWPVGTIISGPLELLRSDA